MRLTVCPAELIGKQERHPTLSVLVDQFVSSIKQREHLVLLFNVRRTISYTKLSYELYMLEFIQCFCKAVGDLLIGSNLFNNNVAIRKFLLNISESYVNMPSTSIRGRLSTISNIDSWLIVLVDHYQPDIRVL